MRPDGLQTTEESLASFPLLTHATPPHTLTPPHTRTPSSHTHPPHTRTPHPPHRTPCAELECAGSSGGGGGGVQPLPRSRRSKNSAASSRRCTLIIRTCSMGTAGGDRGLSALPSPADRRRLMRLQSGTAPGHVRRRAGQPRHGSARSSPPRRPAAPAPLQTASAGFVYLSARARGRGGSSAAARPLPPLPLPPGKCSPAPPTARRES